MSRDAPKTSRWRPRCPKVCPKTAQGVPKRPQKFPKERQKERRAVPKHALALQSEFKEILYTPKLPINRTSGHYVTTKTAGMRPVNFFVDLSEKLRY